MRAFLILVWFKYSMVPTSLLAFRKVPKPNTLLNHLDSCLLSDHLKKRRKTMGNCLVVQGKVVRIMKTDGKILEYKNPIKVEEVLIEFSGHAVSDSLQALIHLQPNTRLLSGQLYYLVPLAPPSPKSGKKVRFAEPEVQGVQESSVVRIKIVISKQELKDMMEKGGISVETMLSSLVHGEKGVDDGEDLAKKYDEDGSQGWKPALESIPEGN